MAGLERLLMYHIITSQPCSTFRLMLEQLGDMPPATKCWEKYEQIVIEEAAV
jgi:hypothetical protein